MFAVNISNLLKSIKSSDTSHLCHDQIALEPLKFDIIWLDHVEIGKTGPPNDDSSIMRV